MDEVRIVEGAVTLELHGYLTSLKVNLPEKEDIVAGDYDLGKTLFEAGIHTAAVEKAVVNQSLVTMRHKISPGDYIIIFPLEIN
jgi:molybdopterin converting factor small subunit